MSKIFIVIVTYNGEPWIEKCLNSCKGYSAIVVDNASKDQTLNIIEEKFPEVQLFKMEKNLGFGQANNFGMRHALKMGAESVFLLNQDAYLVDDALEKMLDFQSQNHEYGILSSLHITGDKNKLDRNFANYMMKEFSSSFYSDHVLGNHLPSVYDVPFVNAAAWLISKKCLIKIGGFDPIFFHYGEDRNYCQRVVYHGFRIGIIPKVCIIHDRDYRKPEHTHVFTTEYFVQFERVNKINFANILKSNDTLSSIKNSRLKIFKSILKCDYKRVSGLVKEIRILNRMKSAILISRKTNQMGGANYL
ncbi:MAG: glycosyltransferase family 2 protein [Psychroserpens sp.]|uniref:glycosyltransferase family 2 protein n=1 Tax=Psychroserpens sp. TaxID=2020870 RepID=UPI003CBA2032